MNENVFCDWIDNNTVYIKLCGEEQNDENIKISILEDCIILYRNMIGDEKASYIYEVQNLDSSLKITQTQFDYLYNNDERTKKTVTVNGYEVIEPIIEYGIDKL